MVSLARDVYRQFYDLAPGLLPDPSDLAYWRATGTDWGTRPARGGARRPAVGWWRGRSSSG